MNDLTRAPEEYLQAPYARLLTPDEESGGYTAEILEFPGCVTEGDTADEALQNLEDAAKGWIEATLKAGREVPEPTLPHGHGGRIALRLPRSLHRRAIQMAERDDTSLNQFLVAAIAERVGAGTLYAQMTQDLEERVTQAAASSVQATLSRAAQGVFRVFGLHWEELKSSTADEQRELNFGTALGTTLTSQRLAIADE